jgi:hypothetical protein
MNYFNVLFDRGQDGERDDWASWQMPTRANPFLDPQEIEAARLDMTEAAFNQEYLALFVNWEGSVFRRVGEAATTASRLQPEPGHEYVIGCDWGRSKDYTVFVVLDTTTRAMVAMDRSNRVDYTVQCGRLRVLNELWHPRQILAEQNSIGQAVIGQLTRMACAFSRSPPPTPARRRQSRPWPGFRARRDSHPQRRRAGERAGRLPGGAVALWADALRRAFRAA